MGHLLMNHSTHPNKAVELWCRQSGQVDLITLLKDKSTKDFLWWINVYLFSWHFSDFVLLISLICFSLSVHPKSRRKGLNRSLYQMTTNKFQTDLYLKILYMVIYKFSYRFIIIALWNPTVVKALNCVFFLP